MNGRVLVITGASSGIGAAVAERGSKRGARVVLAARRERELQAVAARCGGDAEVVVADVTRRDDVARILERALVRFGDVDAWINNAGQGITRNVSELTDDDIDTMVSVNLKSALYGMQAVLPHFKAKRSGQIVNISSMLGRVPMFPPRSAYSAMKHALNALTANLRMELARDYPDIHITTVLPGVVATDFGNNARHGGADSRALPFAQPVDEVADVILDVIEHPRADVYTRPGLKEQVLAYFGAEDMGDVEASLAAPFRPASKPS